MAIQAVTASPGFLIVWDASAFISLIVSLTLGLVVVFPVNDASLIAKGFKEGPHDPKAHTTH